MIDYLLCFPNKDAAVAFGVANGYTSDDPETGEPVTCLGTHDYALSIIGEYITETEETVEGPFGNPIPVKVGDGKHWVLFRDINETIEVPPSAEPFIIWRSDSGEDRPTDAPDRVFA